MAKNPTMKSVEALTHDEATCKNIPSAEHQSLMHDADKTPICVAYERRNRDLDPQLVWRGKDERDWSDLVVQAPPLYIQEKVHPKVRIVDLGRRTHEICTAFFRLFRVKSIARSLSNPHLSSPLGFRGAAGFCRKIPWPDAGLAARQPWQFGFGGWWGVKYAVPGTRSQWSFWKTDN